MDSASELPTPEDALDSLREASRVPAKQRSNKISVVVDVICRHALSDGLDQNTVRDIIQLASVKTHLDQTSVTTLIKNLYPAQRIPSDAITTAVGALGQGKGKPSPGTQECLVKWLTIVHGILEDGNILSRLYGVLFGMLDMISIRTSLCHLLSLITRRKHVRPFRIQQLLELSRGIGNEPALQGLLRVYKDYYPDIILGSAPLSRKSFAPQPDVEWRDRISAIQNATDVADDTMSGVYNGFKVQRKGYKKGKVSVIPEVHTFHATEKSVTLEGIDNVNALVQRLENIEPPGQMISILTDPLLQKYVGLKPSPITETRISLWLGSCIVDRDESRRPDVLSEFLADLYKHTQYTKELHPSVQSFLRLIVLPDWDGKSDMESLLGLLSYLHFEDFVEATKEYFCHLAPTIASREHSSVAKIIDFYTLLLQHTVSFAEFLGPRAIYSVLYDMTTYVSGLIESMILSAPIALSKTIIPSVLSFYEVLSSSSKPHIVPIIIPPMHIVYLLAQDPSLTTLSRICGVLGAYKLAFDKHPKPVKDHYPAPVTDSFNSLLRDIYNLLWVSRGFTLAEKKSTGLFCHPALRTSLNKYLDTLDRAYSIDNALGLASNPLLAASAAAAWRALEEREIEKGGYDRESVVRHPSGPVSQASLDALKRNGGVSVDWDGPEGYKVFVLEWLAQRGLGGIKDQMFATVTNLKGRA